MARQDLLGAPEVGTVMEVRPFAVPINDGFVREAAETLHGYRETG